MSFNNDIAKVKDESQPLGIRYMSLRHCVGLYSPLGFTKTWEFMKNKFGLREGEKNESSVLIQCAEFLEVDRTAWIEVKNAHEKFIKTRVKLGLPKPKCSCEH
ncbi:MAG: hypothetical protein HYZ31_04150 [Gammaproteobacteria bacterium]|nr:hypothetical protein [Gammaproteobacteria bacterium]